MDEKIVEYTNQIEIKKELLQECVEVIKSTPKTHAYTTYQLSLIEETIKKTVEHFKNHYNL